MRRGFIGWTPEVEPPGLSNIRQVPCRPLDRPGRRGTGGPVGDEQAVEDCPACTGPGPRPCLPPTSQCPICGRSPRLITCPVCESVGL